jgi:hypothetical protein
MRNTNDKRVFLWAAQYAQDEARRRVIKAQDDVIRSERFGGEALTDYVTASRTLTSAKEAYTYSSSVVDLMRHLVIDNTTEKLTKALNSIK